jgi:hypothetical protein
LLALALAALAPPAARAADNDYCPNNGDNTIRGAPLAGGGAVDTLSGAG